MPSRLAAPSASFFFGSVILFSWASRSIYAVPGTSHARRVSRLFGLPDASDEMLRFWVKPAIVSGHLRHAPFCQRGSAICPRGCFSSRSAWLAGRRSIIGSVSAGEKLSARRSKRRKTKATHSPMKAASPGTETDSRRAGETETKYWHRSGGRPRNSLR